MKKIRVATKKDFQTVGTLLINSDDMLMAANVYEVRSGVTEPYLYKSGAVVLIPNEFGQEEVHCRYEIMGTHTTANIVYSNCEVVEK